MSVILKIADSFVENRPDIEAMGSNFTLQVGDDKFAIPSVSRMESGEPDPGMRNGGYYQINLRPYESFEIQDDIFETLVKSSEGGGDTVFIIRLLDFVARGILEVTQDDGVPMTPYEIKNYTAPAPAP